MARLRNNRMAATPLLPGGVVANRQKCHVHNKCVPVDEELYSLRGMCL